MKFKSLYINGRPLKSLSINGRKVWGKQEEDDKPYLKFTAEADGSSVSMAKNGTMDALSLVYSTNGGNTWQDFIVGETTVNLDSGDSMYLKASKDDEIVNQCTSLQYGSAYHKFVIGGLVKASGNIMTLLRGDGELDYIPSIYCFARLFIYCTSLTQAPELPATTLANYCYYYMFQGCKSLVEAPELPATTLASSCYQYMFNGCTALTQAPELPATTLANGCYAYMFNGCTSLTQAPDLPANNLASYCYNYMFRGCTSLVEAPSLPATTLANYCYYYMFQGCTSLVKAPELPATTLGDSCYSGMFQGCTSLTQAPELPATTLANGCYAYMFNGCINLNEVKVGYTGEYNISYFTKWLGGVAPNGNLEIPSETLVFPQGESGVPYTWTLNGHEMPEYDGLKFVAREPNSTIKIEKNVASAPSVSLYYSTTKGTTWQSLGTNTITLENVDDEVWIVAQSTNNSFGNSSSGACNQFKMTGKVSAKGNIMSLLTSVNWNSMMTIPESSKGCFYQLFAGCTSLVEAPELPATTLMSDCYNSMFYGCNSLTQAPELPATTLNTRCYRNMFSGCTSLNEMKIGYTGNFSSTYFNDWVQNVSSAGTFYYNGADTTRGTSAIPNNWTIQTF